MWRGVVNSQNWLNRKVTRPSIFRHCCELKTSQTKVSELMISQLRCSTHPEQPSPPEANISGEMVRLLLTIVWKISITTARRIQKSSSGLSWVTTVWFLEMFVSLFVLFRWCRFNDRSESWSCSLGSYRRFRDQIPIVRTLGQQWQLLSNYDNRNVMIFLKVTRQFSTKGFVRNKFSLLKNNSRTIPCFS